MRFLSVTILTTRPSGSLSVWQKEVFILLSLRILLRASWTDELRGLHLIMTDHHISQVRHISTKTMKLNRRTMWNYQPDQNLRQGRIESNLMLLCIYSTVPIQWLENFRKVQLAYQCQDSGITTTIFVNSVVMQKMSTYLVLLYCDLVVHLWRYSYEQKLRGQGFHCKYILTTYMQ